jgi:hypothetical protein
MSLSHGITTTPASPGRTVPAITRRSNPEPEGNQTTDVVYLTCSGADVWPGQSGALGVGATGLRARSAPQPMQEREARRRGPRCRYTRM